MSSGDIEWGFYQADEHWDNSIRRLPHREQAGAITFVTFRLLDSMPKPIVTKWHQEIENWLSEHHLSGMTVEQVFASTTVASNLKRELRKFKNRCWHNKLDDCHGDCVLKHRPCREEVSKSLLHFAGQRYDVDRFVVMPNHVHVLIQMRHGYGLRKQFREIQRFSAREINKILGRSGNLWQGEPFDHIVRHADQLAYLQKYVFDNPSKAHLSPDQYTYRERSK